MEPPCVDMLTPGVFVSSPFDFQDWAAGQTLLRVDEPFPEIRKRAGEASPLNR